MKKLLCNAFIFYSFMLFSYIIIFQIIFLPNHLIIINMRLFLVKSVFYVYHTVIIELMTLIYIFAKQK